MCPFNFTEIRKNPHDFPESNCGRGKGIFRETFPPIFWVILVKICHILNVENFVNPSKNTPLQRLAFRFWEFCFGGFW